MRFLAIFIVFLTIFVPFYSQAESSDWQKAPHSKVRLLAGGYDTPPDFQAAIAFELEEGWKIYWKNPGETGFPVTISVANPAQYSLEMAWPTPKRQLDHYEELTLTSFVYTNQITFPLTITSKTPDQSEPIKLSLNYGICKDICIPVHLEFGLDQFPIQPNEETLKLIQQAQTTLPKLSPTPELSITDITIGSDKNNQTMLQVTAQSKTPFNHADLFIYGADQITGKTPCTSFSLNKLEANFVIPLTLFTPIKDLKTFPLEILVTNGTETVFVKPSLEQIKPTTEPLTCNTHLVSDSSTTKNRLIADLPITYSLWFILGLSLIGGIILNLMPCVLPVISIKIFSILHSHHMPTSRIRMSFLMTALGIMMSFMILAGLVIILKSFGTNLGWGFQFQYPPFVIFLIIVLILFAAIIWDLLPIRSFSGLNLDNTKQHHPYLYYFLTGCFATLLATPCTAPFLGTAAGFALLQSPILILLIFTIMGIGMALPYLLLMLFPKVIQWLPKPGHWMVYIKQVMGILLLLTALWLIWILSFQLGIISAAILLSLSVLYLLVLMKHRFIGLLSLIYIVIAFLVPLTLTPNPAPILVADKWVTFSEESIEQALTEQQTIFLDLTASWCLTCKANKFLTLDSTEIKNEFSKRNIIAMRGDWTNADSHITEFLSKHQRAGVPYNAVFCAAYPQGIILPELLTKQAVITALDKCIQ